MEPSPKAICIRCGVSILQITFDLTGGHCMPCANAMARAKEPVTDYVRRRNPEPILKHRHPAENVIISVCYIPGWTPDLTSWVIQISDDGILRQAVDWDREEGREEELLDPVMLTSSGLAGLQQLIASCSPDTFRSLTSAATIDDVPMVSLVIPAHDLHVDLPYFDLTEDVRFDESQLASFQLFGELWRFADRHAPYSLRHHEKGVKER